MDSFAALALATEPPDPALLRRRPEGRTTPLISPIMRKMIVGQSIFQTALLLFLTLTQAGADMFEPALAISPDPSYVRGGRTHLVCVFNAFVFLTIFNKFNARKLHDDQLNVFAGFLHSAFAPVIMFIIFALQILIVEVGTKAVMQTVPLNVTQWFVCVAVGLTTLPVGLALRFIPTVDPSIVSDEEVARAMRSLPSKTSTSLSDGQVAVKIQNGDINAARISPLSTTTPA